MQPGGFWGYTWKVEAFRPARDRKRTRTRVGYFISGRCTFTCTFTSTCKTKSPWSTQRHSFTVTARPNLQYLMSKPSSPKNVVTVIPWVYELCQHWELPHVHYLEAAPVLSGEGSGVGSTIREELGRSLAVSGEIDVSVLAARSPEIVIVDNPTLVDPPEKTRIASLLSGEIGREVLLVPIVVGTLDSLFEGITRVGKLVGASERARDLCGRIKAQLMDWCDSFYDRLKNKRVTVVSSVAPLRVAGLWIPEVIQTASCHPQYVAIGGDHKEVTWNDIESFRPDVLIIAPEGYSLDESVKTLRLFERNASWESVPAVKRGEVVFCDGVSLYRPGHKLLDGIAALISGIAGLESGYISPRDSFYRLRWVELHRHKFQ